MNPRRTKARLLLAAALPGILSISASARGDLSADQTPFHSYRGWWVDRFDYSSASDIRTMMIRAADLGITDVMFQVRGQADAYYWLNDGIETRHSSISSTYDPLAIAIAEGHSRGIKVHAWMNAMPIWNGTTPPSNPNHLYNAHPEFRVKDANGNDQPLNSSYVVANPARPDFQAHVNSVVNAVAKNYAVDGIHLDYIRLLNFKDVNGVLQYPADSYTVSLFQQQYPGQTPSSHPSNYRTWMASRISDLVASVRQTTKTARPGAQVTASVWRSASIGLNDYQQDWARWVNEGFLDAAIPMIYHGSGHTSDFYTPNVTEALNRVGNAGIIVGLGTYLQDDPATAYANTMYQLTHARDQGANGVQLFDYRELYRGTAADNAVLQAITDFFNANRNAPAAADVADFEAGEGTFKWSVTTSSSNLNVAGGSADRVTDQQRSGAGSQRIEINKTAGAASFLMRHVSGSTTAGDYNSNTNFASIGTVGFWLKTTTPDVQVAIALDDTSTGDRSYFMNVIADGEWHKYEWFLNDVTQWDSWVGGDGKIATRFAIDSIHFTGTQSANTLWLDDVFQDAAAVAPNQWTLGFDGAWNNAANWTGGVPSGVGAAANLMRRAAGGAKISLPGGTTTKLGTLRFDNSASYEVAGPGTLTMQAATGAAAAVGVINRGSHRISAPMVMASALDAFVDRGSSLEISGSITNTGGRSLSKSGDGALTLKGAQFHGAGAALNVARGTVNLDSSGGANLAVSIGSGAALNMRADQRLKSLAVAPGGSAKLAPSARRAAVDHLAVNAAGVVDIGQGSLIVHSDSPSSDLAGISELIRSARSGGTWTGTGIGSSDIASVRFTTVAAIRNLASDGISPLMGIFAGEEVDVDAVLITYTWTGDLNFDGLVTLADYTIINHGYQQGMSGYGNGDVNFDGRINGDDFKMMDRSFLRQNRRLAGSVPPQGAPVPEPSTSAIFLLAPLVMRRRGRAPKLTGRAG